MMQTPLGLALVVGLLAASVLILGAIALSPTKPRWWHRMKQLFGDGWAWLVTLCQALFTDADVQADARFTPPKLENLDQFQREDETVIYAFTFKKAGK